MNKEILYITAQLKDAFEGDPWFGRNAKSLLAEIDEEIAFDKPNQQHSILQLVWHMITWREFVISRLKKDETKELHYFETNDWRILDHTHKTLWHQGLQRLYETQDELIEIIGKKDDDLLNDIVEERNYNFRKLLNGVLQHDIYHLGQIAYIKKLLLNK